MSDRDTTLHIAQERPEDADAIRAVTNAAFKGLPYSDQTEARIVDRLRETGALTLSLVAIREGAVVAHAAFSPVRINGVVSAWHGLGPVSVLPEHQRQGIGTALISNGLQLLEALGSAGCVVLGSPAYYRRFGFVHDPDLGYGNVPAGYFQRLTLHGPSAKGEVAYHFAFSEAQGGAPA